MINKRSEDIIKNMMIDDLNGVVCFIPSIVVGESMAIMSSNAVWVRYRTTPIVSISIDANTGVYSVHTEDVSYEILDLEKDQKRRKKRIVSTLYMESRILHNPLREEKDPDGHLFADGRYRTKIFASDLPEYFVYGYLYKRHGFISAASVKHDLPFQPQIAVMQPVRKGPGFFAALLGLTSNTGSAPRHPGRCTGDCAHCPAHYGYRYGRWYYGHHHTHGCEFGGNDGSGKP